MTHLFFLRFQLFTFRERGREEEREGERHQCVVASHKALTGDLTHNPGRCPDQELNKLPFGSQLRLSPLSHTSQGSDDTFKHVMGLGFLKTGEEHVCAFVRWLWCVCTLLLGIRANKDTFSNHPTEEFSRGQNAWSPKATTQAYKILETRGLTY